MDEKLIENVIIDCYKMAGKFSEMDGDEVASKAISVYVAYRTCCVLSGGVEYYNKMHEKLMDLSLDISDDIIKSIKSVKRKKNDKNG